MQIKISARHGHLNEATQEFIREKAQKLLHYFDRLTMIEVTVDLKDEVNRIVEFLVSAEHKHDFVASERNPDILAAVDLVLAKLESRFAGTRKRSRTTAGDPRPETCPVTPPEAESGQE